VLVKHLVYTCNMPKTCNYLPWTNQMLPAYLMTRFVQILQLVAFLLYTLLRYCSEIQMTTIPFDPK